MTNSELLEYVKNPSKIYITHKGEAVQVPVRNRASFISKTVNDTYIMALTAAYNRLDINFMAGVDNATTLQEFKDWLRELGVDIDKQYID